MGLRPSGPVAKRSTPLSGKYICVREQELSECNRDITRTDGLVWGYEGESAIDINKITLKQLLLGHWKSLIPVFSDASRTGIPVDVQLRFIKQAIDMVNDSLCVTPEHFLT